MNSMDNPLPAFPAGDQHVPPAPPAITPAMMEFLKQTKPWVRFVSIMGFIGTALLFLIGLFLILGAGLVSSLSQTAFGGAPVGVIGFVYAALGLLYFFPDLHLFRYADGIKKALSLDPVGGVEDALRHQKSFWRFVGILVLIVLILQIVALIGVIVFISLAGVRGRI